MMEAASLALAVAIVALIVSVAALRAARAAAARPTPAPAAPVEPIFQVSILEGEARRAVADDTRDYALSVMFMNGLGVGVRLSRVTLRVTYLTRANFLGAVDLEPRPGTATDARKLIEWPVAIPPRTALRGWMLFSTSNVIPRHCRVVDYALIVHTDQGKRHTADATRPAMLAADTDGQGPATWGWD
jgi:hypothetical protein